MPRIIDGLTNYQLIVHGPWTIHRGGIQGIILTAKWHDFAIENLCKQNILDDFQIVVLAALRQPDIRCGAFGND